MCKACPATKQKTSVSVLGLYGNFQALRSGSYDLRRHGLKDRDFSVLFCEDAVTSCDGIGVPADRLFGQSRLSLPLIGGTFEGLSYLGAAEQGIIAGAIMSLGVPSYEAEEYEIGICNKRLLLCVRSPSAAFGDVAMQILLHSGAECIVAVPQSNSPPDIELDKGFHSMSSLEARFIC